MVDYSKWFTPNQKGKIQINNIAIYRSLSLEVVNKLDSNLSVSEIIAWIRQRTIQAFQSKYSRRPTDKRRAL
ncbi:Cfr10I/Bse634I family restriction endonuclease [Coleofasciculus sp. B1-GNL1-01]|uniref:Cfr10I/Bse634I family restriction endonuclease n=1 Tax=Coleofasciculus sp. B1-GNL1-01 TaxID=3068484 RepID=UPI0040637814